MSPLTEASTLIEDTTWDSTRAALFQGASVTVLISPRRRDSPDASDVHVSVVPATPGPMGGVAVILAGRSGCWEGTLDRLGRCTIRDVPDASYSVRLQPT